MVDELLAACGLKGDVMVPVPSHHYEEPGQAEPRYDNAAFGTSSVEGARQLHCRLSVGELTWEATAARKTVSVSIRLSLRRTKDSKMSLRQALSKCYDLRSPKNDLLKLLGSLPGQVGGTQGGDGPVRGQALDIRSQPGRTPQRHSKRS